MQKSGESQVSIDIHIWHSSDSSDQDVLAASSNSDSKSDHKLVLLPAGRKLKQQLPASRQDSDKPTRPLTANTVWVSHLPPFTQVNSKWRKIFIPSLYNTFFHSEAPFKDFVLETSKFISIVQDLVDRIYPEVDYTIKGDDPILLLVSTIISMPMCCVEVTLRLTIASMKNGLVSEVTPLKLLQIIFCTSSMNQETSRFGANGRNK